MMLFCAFGVQGQRTTSVRLNEVLVINEDNFVDDYGVRSGWIELFNSSPATVNLGGCFLTNDKNNKTMYMIPKGDVLTKIPPRQHVLFWADKKASRGTFHLNFELNRDKENYIAFYDADGKTLIDEVTIPAGQHADVSYGLAHDGTKAPWESLAKVTPSSNNEILNTNKKIENFQTNDAWGIGMTLTAMVVVFLGLLLLFLVFKYVGITAIKAGLRRSIKASGNGDHAKTGEPASGEVYAAIFTALYEVTDEDAHDLENMVLTIHKVARNYSPWNSKIYGLREPINK